MRQLFSIFVILLAAVSAYGQESVLRAAMYLSGASSEEEVPEGLLEQLEGLHPVRVNSPRLRAGVLLSDYQVASILDYRAVSGDILSWEELALLDGFSSESVAVLRPFLSLESSSLPGSVDTVRLHSVILARGSLKNAGGKVKFTGKSWQFGGAFRGYYEGQMDGSFHLVYAGRLGRLVLGNYNLRYGQGLALWSGFSMTSLSTVDAFLWRTTGISPVWSFNSSAVFHGVAYEYSSRHFRGAVFGSIEPSSGSGWNGLFKHFRDGGLYALLGAHLDWLGRHGQVGFSVLKAVPSDTGGMPLTLSADTRWNWKGLDLAAEVAWRDGGSMAVKSALRKRVGENWKLAVQGRAIPSRFSGKKNGEYAAALGTSFVSGRWVPLSGRTGFGSSVPSVKASLTAEAALLPVPSAGETSRLQVRVYSSILWQFSPSWNLALRLTERYRNYEAPRSALRADLRYASGPWNSALRLEGVHCGPWTEAFSAHLGGLTYLEGGFKGAALSAYLRLSAFLIDTWPCRIYTYERDAPGNFSVPAYYGRGLSLSAFAGWKHRFSGPGPGSRGGSGPTLGPSTDAPFSSGVNPGSGPRVGSGSNHVSGSRSGSGSTLRLYLRASILLRHQQTPTPTLTLQLQWEY